MRLMLVVFLIISASSCNHSNSYKRGYVISHVHDDSDGVTDVENEE